MNNSEKAGIWLRVSTLDQSEESQLPDCVKYAETKGYEVVETYPVHGASARKGNRRFDAAWAKVIDDVRHGKITTLIVWRLSRLDRKLQAYRMIEEARDNGCRVEFAQQPHLNDLSTMAGRISLKIEEEIAFAESQEKSEREVISIRARREKGLNTGKYPWGLVSIESKLYPTDEGRKWVTYAFEEIVKGRSPGEIAATFRTAEVHPKCHGLFIKRMIANETYRGLIVDAPTWDAANDALANAPRYGRPPVARPKPLLTPLCLSCDGPMYTHKSTKTGQLFYRCYGRNNERSNGRHDIRGCGARLVPLEEANARIIAMFSDDEAPHTVWKYAPGDDVDRQIREALEAGATAMRKGDLQAATDAMRTVEELKNTPRVEAGWREVETGQTRGQWWAEASVDERRTFLARFPISVGKDKADVVHVRIGKRIRAEE